MALSVCASGSAIPAHTWFPGISGARGPRNLGRGHAATWLSAVLNSSTRARWFQRLRRSTEPWPFCASAFAPRQRFGQVDAESATAAADQLLRHPQHAFVDGH